MEKKSCIEKKEANYSETVEQQVVVVQKIHNTKRIKTISTENVPLVQHSSTNKKVNGEK